jgi:hypothetical protein
VALEQGIGSFDLKYLGFFAEGLEDEAKKEKITGQLVFHASEYALKNNADQLVALYAGTRAEAQTFWGRFGFNFIGVGPGPDYAVRMALIIKR